MIKQWLPPSQNIWQGRDDSAESPLARRVFQVIHQATSFEPAAYSKKIALLGFMCDEGVRINKGRRSAKEAPDIIRNAMANFAAHDLAEKLVDFGNIIHYNESLEEIQYILGDHIQACHQHNLVTLVFGGGHETAYAHGLGLYNACPDKKIGIINFDAHLDLRTASEASSGTPFKQLADYCQDHKRPFYYMCIGASLASNTEALLKTAEQLDVKIIWDTDCNYFNLPTIITQLDQFIDQVDILYLTIDLDALPAAEMFAVSAPSSLGVETRILLNLAQHITNTGKLRAVDLVEYNPNYDQDRLCARHAARFAWQVCNYWQHKL